MHPILYIYLAIACYVVYGIVLALYRLTFHPLARFPGSKLAAATKWYEAYFDLVKSPGGQFMVEIDRMHEKYGPIVRINPDELHVKDAEWAETLYCNSSHGARDKYPPAAMMTGTPKGVFGTVKHDVHRRRRAAINHFFSKNAINNVEPMIQEMTSRLCQNLSQAAASGIELEMQSHFLAITTDVVCQHTFQRNLGLLHSTKHAHNWKETIRAIAILTPLAKQFTWIIPMALKVPVTLLNAVVPSLGRIVQLHRVTIQNHSSPDITKLSKSQWGTDADVKEQQSTIFQSCLKSRHLDADEKKLDRLAQEAFTIIVAGGETTARVLTTATFYMVEHKERVILRLRDELRSISSDFSKELSLKALEQLPWLSAIIKESLRITALVTSRLPLISPDSPLHYREWIIPAGTPVSMSLRDVLLDDSIFKNPHEFHPERWLAENPSLARISKLYMPFGRGSRMCVGLNLALAELYLILGTLFDKFEFDLFETTKERDIDIVRDCFIGEPSTQSQGVRVKVRLN
ncbi:putative flavonoid 3-hydroxylase [Macroventuria anomochaeta]|uniref:Flavonoid 3-hydroxylase n=1 Tax=Macroventuria anomochaeta TaxID=301207 RepID=A0ACB6SAB3_9PLEO|nr:putative flavonoid 3-hydroxylase [Macroventuria anomochaeta]KAF2630917.1 putative flavonoid 3-hydroxylase [Macroventuria anomochaeta]